MTLRIEVPRRTDAGVTEAAPSIDLTGIVTCDPEMLSQLRKVAQVAGAAVPVLIRGETGTGKELVARALHVNSPRRAQPFVALHCAALAQSLFETELFGHRRGAFSGAERDRGGRIASARGGTLFLDEIGELSLDLQVKLLRFLESGEIQPVGADRCEHVDVRVVCATHRDLGQLRKQGQFRDDLYYRIHVVEILLPPLRQRAGDRELLIEHFVTRFSRERGMALQLTAEARAALLAHDFPGNARELEHAIERMVLLATSAELGSDLLPAAIRPVAHTSSTFHHYTAAELNAARASAIADVEARFLDGLLHRSGGNISAAARIAGMPRGYVQKLVARQRSR